MMVVGMNGAMNCSSLYRLASELSHRYLFTKIEVPHDVNQKVVLILFDALRPLWASTASRF